MKTITQIINQEPVFLNIFTSKLDVISEFNGVYLTDDDYQYLTDLKEFGAREEADRAIERHKNDNILFASYGYENYSGDAWVLFERDGKLYEVNGQHCSCFGLEGQWEPEEVYLPELKNRLMKGTFGTDYEWSGNVFALELIEFLGIELHG